MFKRSRIAMLVAGALFAAQAGAELGQSEALWSDGFPPPEQITVFNPDGSSYSIVPIEMDVVSLEPILSIVANEPPPEHLTVFEPNGLIYSYEFTPVEPVVLLEPIDVVVMEDDVSIDVVAMEDDVSNDVVAMEDDVSNDVVAMEDDVSIDPVALNDDDALSQPVYVAHFVSPPSYTGILEEARS